MTSDFGLDLALDLDENPEVMDQQVEHKGKGGEGKSVTMY